MPRVFVSYRRTDTQPLAGRLADRLQQRLGKDHVFYDHGSISAGERWPDTLRQGVSQCDVLLALIGKSWLREQDEHGRRRIDDPEDWVRREVATALKAGKRVIPLLVDGEKMPMAEGLPEELRDLPNHQALPLRSGADFDKDINDLLRELEPHTADGAQPPTLPGKPPLCAGRERERTQLLDLLLPAEPDTHVEGIPVCGVGGIGKSTLVRDVMHHPRVVERYGDRRHFVRLDAATNPAGVMQEVAKTLGVPLQAGFETQVFRSLEASQPRLLVLDNAETPLGGEDRLGVEELFQQLAQIPALAAIATLRAVETPGPGWREAFEVRFVDLAAAREIFRKFAGRFGDDPGLDGLLREMEGLPLAIQLLARQARYYGSLKELKSEWEQKRARLLQLGQKGKKDADLGASIELSLNSRGMTGAGRRVLSLLGLLPSGVLAEDGQSMLGAVWVDGAAALRQVGGLMYEEAGRLRVLAPMREYFAEQVQPTDQDFQTAIRFYSELAKREGWKAGREGGAEAIARMAAETGNVVSSIDALVFASEMREAMAAASGLGQYCYITGVDFSPVLTRVKQKAATAELHWERAELGWYLGNIAIRRNQHAATREHYTEALLLFHQLGDLLGEAKCMLGLADSALLRCDCKEARAHYNKALPLFSQMGSRLGEASCIWRLGDIARLCKEHGTARVRYEQALALYREMGDVLGEANCIQSLGELALRRNEHAEARAHYAKALPLFHQVGDVLDQANCIRGLGDIALERSEHAEARAHYEEALELYGRIQDTYSIGNVHHRLSRLSESEDERRAHVQAAWAAWNSLDMVNLTAQLRQEFGDLLEDV